MPGLYAQHLLQLIQHFPAALDIAGRTHAHADGVLPFRLQVELRVERGHAVDVADRNIHFLGDVLLHILRQIAKDVLRPLHNRHQRARFVSELVDHPLQCLDPFFFKRHVA